LLNRKITLLLALAIFFAAFGFLPVSAAENQANLSVSVVERKSTDTINDFDFEEQKIDRFNDDGYGCGLDSGSYDCDQTSIFAYFALPAVLFLIVGISKIVEAKKSKNKRLI